MAYIRTVKTASGATAVQIVHSSRKGSRDIEHIGSAHTDAEVVFLPPALRNGAEPADHGRLLEEVAAYLAVGVDGVFSDHPDIAAAARDAHTA